MTERSTNRMEREATGPSRSGKGAGEVTVGGKHTRREALKLLSAVAALPALARLSADELLALGRTVHEGLGPPGLHVFRTLDAHQGATVKVIVDLILPETDTPGALAVRADEFIDVMLTDVLEEKERERLLRGLVALDGAAQEAFGRAFVECPREQQVKLLEAQEQEAVAAAAAAPIELAWGRRKPPKEHFFHVVKHLTLLSFYTSEAGLVGELGFELIPGTYAGCPRR